MCIRDSWRTLKGNAGDLYTDVYSAWPKKVEIMVGAAPEVRHRAGWTKYTIEVDNKIVSEDEFSPWILGREDIDLKISKTAKIITLKTQNEDRRKGGGFILGKGECLFWGGGQLVLADGTMLSLSELQKQNKITLKGVRTQVHGRPATEKIKPGEDYYGGPVVIAGKPFQETLPAQPNGNGEIHIDLTGLNVKRFKISLGADYPPGKVTKYQRNSFSTRSHGKSAHFLTLIEPFDKESSSMIQSVSAVSSTELRVSLKDGTENLISIKGLEGISMPSVNLKEIKDGKITAEEKS